MIETLKYNKNHSYHILMLEGLEMEIEEFAAHYPFTKQAKDYFIHHKVELNEEIINLGRKRLENMLGGDWDVLISIETEKEIASFAAAKMIISASNTPSLIYGFAVGESKRASKFLSKDSYKDSETIIECAEGIGLELKEENDMYHMNVAEYLMSMPRSSHYYLVNREVKKGNVKLNKHEAIRVLEEGIRRKIEKELPQKSEFSSEIKKIAEELKKKEMEKRKKELKFEFSGDFPPCAEEIISKAKEGANLSHVERWFIAVYLNKIGWKEGQIIDLFRKQPDFKESITRYQVGYVKKKNYSVPSCARLNSEGVCAKPCGIRSPLSFRKKT